MTKQEFLQQLQNGLNELPKAEIDERIAFYSEMIDDLLEEGLSEEDAVAKIGNVDEVVTQIVADNHFVKLSQSGNKPRRKLRAWEIVLLIVGAPVWGSLLIAAIAVAFSIYVSIWAGIVSLWAVFVSLVACVLAGAVGGIIAICQGHSLTGLATIGAGVFCAGLSIFAFFGCLAVTKVTVQLTKKAILWVKNRFTKKEEA